MRIVVGVAAWLLAGSAALDAAERQRPRYIHDEKGRIVLYHGINVANTAKHAPGHLPWQTRADFGRLREWGLNLVRYLVFWEAIEPTPGHYDETYMARTLERLGWLGELGIDVLLDVHQDLYARRFGGNGFPDWTVNDGGHPYKPARPWHVNYFQPAVRACYEHFWTSPALKAKYVAMLRHLLTKVDGLGHVIGLEIMNEPFPCPKDQFEEEILSAFYRDVQAMRRRGPFKTRLFFEPMIYTSVGLSTKLRFKPDKGCVYAPHYYDPYCHEGRPYTPTGKRLMRAAVQRKVAEALSFGTPLLFTEFGLPAHVQGGGDYLDDLLDLMDEYHLSWTYWSYDRGGRESFGIVDKDGRGNKMLSHLVRVYPQRIAGRNPSLRHGDKCFELAYDPIDTTAPTVIFLPRTLRGVRATVNGQVIQVPARTLHLEHRNQGATTRQVLRVTWQ